MNNQFESVIKILINLWFNRLYW